MGKYNVGDKVRIISECGANWNSDGLMDKHCGTVMTIWVTNAFGCDGLYRMEEDRHWLFSDEDIVGLVDDANDANDVNEVKETKDETPKYKIGDRVIVDESNIDFMFGSHSDKHGEIVNIHHDSDHPYQVKIDNDATLWCKVKCLAPEKKEETKGEKKTEKIVITHDGKTTTATLYREDGTVETATARCAPEDTFDFNFGAKLAMERLMEKVAPKWKFETGDYAKVISCKSHHGIKIGTVVKLERDGEDGGWYKVYDDSPMGFWYVKEEELEVYEPPKYYNGKVVCVESDHSYITVGKVYTFVDGTVIDDDGDTLYDFCPIKDLSEIKSQWKFIPIVE